MRDHGISPRVSVIVRSMDRPLLKQALDSIARQTYGNLEIVVVNAKGPNHAEVPSQWGGRPVHCVSTGKPMGRCAAANAGLYGARGDYLCFLDDDDVFLPCHVEALVTALESTKGIRAAYAGVRVEAYAKWQDILAAIQPRQTFDFNAGFSRRRLQGRNYIPMHAVLFDAGLVRDHGCHFDEGLELFEDWDFWLQIARHTDFLHLDRITAIYRNCGESGLGHESSTQREQRIVEATSRVYGKWKDQWTAEDWAAMVLFRDTLTEEAYAKVSQLTDDLQQAAASVDALESALASAEERIRSLTERLDNESFLTNQLRLANAELLGSASWRATQPIRWLAGWFWGRKPG